MSHKRLSALALMLALIVPILAACGGGGTGGTNNGAATSPAGPTAGSEATTAPAATTATSGSEATSAPAATAGASGAATAGAAAGGAATGATAGANGDLTKIKVEDGATLRFDAAGNATEQKIYLDGIKRFNQVFPNVKVNFEPIASDYQTQMNAQFSANAGPDVLIIDGQLMGQLGYNGVLLALDDAMRQAGVQASDYVDPLIKLYQYQGKTYAIPKDFNPLVVFINTDLAQQAGVDPASIKTWDDLTNAAKKMTSGSGPGKKYGMCLNPDIERVGASMLQNGNPIIQDNKAVFDQPNAVQALNFWYSFKKDGTGELYSNLGRTWCGEAFGGRNTAMAVEGGWLLPFLADPANGATNLKFTAVPLPTPSSGKPATWLFTNGFGANANSKYPNAAAALVLFLTSAMNEKAVIPSGLAQPSLKALANDPYFTQNAVAKVLVEQGPTGQLSDIVLGGPLNKGDVINAINKGALEPTFLGAQPAQQALSAAAQQVNTILQKK